MGTLCVLWYCAREIIYGRLTIGGFVAFKLYLGFFYDPSRFLDFTNVYMRSAFAALKCVFCLIGPHSRG